MKTMKNYRSRDLVVALVLSVTAVSAQVPSIISYQGRVQVAGANFTGSGLFKFALVDRGTNSSRQAIAQAVRTGNFITSVDVLDGGAGYFVAPAVTFSGGGGSGTMANAQVSGGSVVSIDVFSAGSGYSSTPTVTVVPPPGVLSYVTYWSNDGTSSGGSQPATAVSVAVAGGLFTVLLGDTNLPNMSVIPPAVAVNRDLHLRIWFNDGVSGFAQLAPDQRLSSTPYALIAGNVTDGVVTTAKLAPGAVTLGQIPAGVALLNGPQNFNGPVTAVQFNGNGSGLSNLSSSSLTGLVSTAPRQPVSIDTDATIAAAGDVAITGDYAYVANGSLGLATFDVSRPSGPTPLSLGSTNPTGNAVAVAVSGNYAYVALGFGGLRIYDITVRSNPVVALTFTGLPTADIAIVGNYAYLASLTNAVLTILDISNPVMPTIPGSFPTGPSGDGVSIAVSGNFAYLSTTGNGLSIFNIANPASPAFVARTNNGCCANGVAVSGNYAFLANGLDGVRIYDVSNPATPMNVGRAPTTGLSAALATAVTASGRFVYAGGSSNAFQVWDISIPTNPLLVGRTFNSISVRSILLSSDGAYAYTADGFNGLRTYSFGAVVINGALGINTATPNAPLDVVGEARATVFTPTSDRNAKENFQPIDPREVLARVAALPIMRWNFKDLPGAEHVGPMAQDFHLAFHLGADNKHIATVDADGIALAAIQGLDRKLEEQLKLKETEIERLKQTVSSLQRLVTDLREEVKTGRR